MKKILCFALFLTLAGAAFAEAYTFDDFETHITRDNLEAFAKDAGGLLGSGVFSTGRILGWGGFQLAVKGAYMPKPSDENTALGSDKKEMFYPFIQGEIGLPFRLDGFIRASSWDGLTLAGGGLKWGIVRPQDTLYTFQPMITVMAQNGVHKAFSLTQYSANFVLSFKLPYVVPYIGAGADITKVTVESCQSDPTLVGERKSVTTPRATLGLNVKLPSYIDLSVAANYVNYGIGAEASLGVRF